MVEYDIKEGNVNWTGAVEGINYSVGPEMKRKKKEKKTEEPKEDE